LSWRGDELKVALQAPPEKGKANQALQKFLAKSLGLSLSQIQIVSGLSNPSKTLELDMDPEDLLRQLPPRINP
jgi:uncharacterized protein